MGETTAVSIHLVRVVRLLRGQPGEWFTNGQIAKAASVAPRTARAHSLRLVNLGMVDEATVFPGHRYRWSGHAQHRNAAFLRRVEAAEGVFGVEEAV